MPGRPAIADARAPAPAGAADRCGTIKYLNGPRGFGFVRGDLGGADIFVHETDLDPSLTFLELNVGMRVRFQEADNHGKGIRAVRVRRL